jgi:hypothetical protein
MSVRTNNARLLGGVMIFALLVVTGPITGAWADVVIRGSVPPYTDAPVFYDLFWDYHAHMENLELVHEGKVKLETGIESIGRFDWIARRGDTQSYWVLMENFWYLTPVIRSTAERDKAFVRDWFEGWLNAHQGVNWKKFNWGAQDGMSAGFRVMTFAWYLRLLHEQGEVDSLWVARIRGTVKEHQEYLRKKSGFGSNHQYWVSMGLFETTRVCPDSALVRLALRRLDKMVALSITERGFHIERSPHYHFAVWDWITQYVRYFRALKGFEWSGLENLEAAESKMNRASYYLFDHDGNVPQVGDTDMRRLDKELLRSLRRPNMPEVFVDKRAGYAIYKDTETQRGRYIVFSVPNAENPNDMPYHNHDDVLSVYYSHRGEIILGDQGRFSYGKNVNRVYFKSAAAHNTVLPAWRLAVRRRVESVASDVWVFEEKDFDVFTASLEHEQVTRTVRVSKDGMEVEVFDKIFDNGPYVVLWHMGADVDSVRRIDAVGAQRVTPDSRTEFSFELTTSRQRRFLLTISTDTGPPASENAIDVVSGLNTPMLGWYSPTHEQKVPIPVIKLNLDVRVEANVATTIKPFRRQ